jgi:hypothetical protein
MSTTDSPQLAILISAPQADEASMHHDLEAMYKALKQRGLKSEEILCLEGKLDRRLLLGFLEAIHHRISDWVQGSLFLYVTGHGFFSGESADDARVGVALAPSGQGGEAYHIFWDRLFQALSVPQGVALTLLPDL